MTIREFVDLFYIKSYLKNQDRAFKNLVKGSVESYDLLTYDDDSYHGILAGNNPHMFAKQVIDAGLTVEKISHHIETLYPIKHNGSVKTKEQYQNKTYQEALFDQVKDKFDGITLENMSDILANALFTIMQDEANEKESATSRPPKPANSSNTADIQNDISTDLPDVLSTVEKEDIEHYCGLINSSLQNIKRQAEALERKQREISDLTFVLENSLPKNRHSRKIWHRQKVKVLWKPEHKWKIPNSEWVKARRRYKEYQENESKKLIENADSNYNQLEKYCRKMTHQLITKQDLDPSIKAIYEIIQKIGDKKYKATTPETFSYSALSLLVSDYQNRYRRLLIFIQGK